MWLNRIIILLLALIASNVAVKQPDDSIPVFEKYLYETQYQENYFMDPIDIILDSSSSTSEPTVKIEKAYESYFKWQNGIFSLQMPLPADTFSDVDYIIVSLHAYFDIEKGSGQTAVIIKAPVKQSDLIPVFEKYVYETQYQKNDLMDPIDIRLDTSSSSSEPTVKIESPYQNYFKWQNGIFYLQMPLPVNTFDDVDYIIVSLQAYFDIEKGSGKTAVIIKAPVKQHEDENPIPVFEKNIYEGQYKETGEMDNLDIILDTSLSTYKPTVKIDSQYESYFKWEDDKFSLMNPLPHDTFDNVNYITVTIEAFYDKEKGSGKTVVIINAPEKEEGPEDQIPVFEKPFYITNMLVDYVIDPIIIKIQEVTNDNLYIVIESEYREYLKWEDDRLASTRRLPQEIFGTQDYITVTIEAYYDRSRDSGKTVVIINAPEIEYRPEDPIPNFEKPLYTTNAKNDYTIDPITIKIQEVTNDNLYIEIESEYQEYFKWEYNLLASKQPLPEEMFNRQDYITVIIQAFSDKSKGSGKTVVIVNAPEKEEGPKDPIPSFEEPLYITDAKEDYSIEPIKIEFQEVIVDSVKVDIEAEYQENFKWEHNTLSSVKPLPKEVFYEMDYITVTIEAYYDKTKGSGKTVIIINAPKNIPEVPPVFKKPLYTTNAHDDYNIEIIKIEIQEPIKNYVQVEIEAEYQEYFKWNFDILWSAKPLPKEIFNKVDYIAVTIEAYYEEIKGSGKTVLIINAPEKISEIPFPIFVKPLYITDANDNSIIHPLTIELQEPIRDNLIVDIEPKYEDYFEWDAHILWSTKPLPEEIFDTTVYITVTIEAFYDKDKGSGKTVVIINAPVKKTNDPIPRLNEPVYKALYKKIVAMDTIEIKLDTSTSTSTPIIENESQYTNFFKIKNDKHQLNNKLRGDTVKQWHAVIFGGRDAENEFNKK